MSWPEPEIRASYRASVVGFVSDGSPYCWRCADDDDPGQEIFRNDPEAALCCAGCGEWIVPPEER